MLATMDASQTSNFLPLSTGGALSELSSFNVRLRMLHDHTPFSQE